MQRDQCLAFAINVFNLTIGGRHAIKEYVDGSKLYALEFPGHSTEIFVEKAGFNQVGKKQGKHKCTHSLASELHIPSTKQRSSLLHVLELRFCTKATTNSVYFGNSIPALLQKIMCTKADEPTAQLLGIDVGEVHWPNAQFGASSNLHADQQAFWEGDWVRFCAALGDCARWTDADAGEPAGTRQWVGRAINADNAMGDGLFFTYILGLLQSKWRIVGDSLCMPFEHVEKNLPPAQVKVQVNQWLTSTFTTLNQPANGLTYSGAV